MHTPVYRQVISSSWRLAWRNKYLWLFAFFAGLLINGGAFDLAVRLFTQVTTAGAAWDMFISEVTAPYSIIKDVTSFWVGLTATTSTALWTIIVIVIGLALTLLLIALSIFSQGALIAGVDNVNRKKTETQKKAINAGLENFWPIFLINLVLKIATILLVVFVSFPLVLLLSESVALNAVLYLLSFIIFIAIAIILYFLAIFASCYIVLRGKKFSHAIALAWELFKRNWIICIELALLLFVITFLGGLGVILIIMVISVPIVLLFLAALALNSSIALIAIFVIAVLLFAAVAVIGSAFLIAFQYSAWVLLFERLTKKGALARIVRWLTTADAIGKTKKKKSPAKKKKK